MNRRVVKVESMRFLMIAGFAESLLGFRGPLIAELQARGLQVHVAAPDLGNGQPQRDRLEAHGLVVHDIPLKRTGINPLSDIRTVWALWRLMRRIRPDYVLGYTIKAVIYGSISAWLGRVPRRFALITGLGYAFQDGSRYGLLRALAERLYVLALARVHKVFFQNPDDERQFRRGRLIVDGVPSRVVNGSGVDLATFAVECFPEGGPTFLLIARLLADKGVREYAQAARSVRARHPETRFAMVGWIDQNPSAVTQAELDRWVGEGTLEYWGRLSDVRPAIARSSVYVLPSYREGTPRTVLEAMAMGRAVITTDAPGCRETVIDGENGFLVPIKSVEGLERAMLKFVEDPKLAAKMGQRSRQIAQEKYDVRKVNEIMLREMGIA